MEYRHKMKDPTKNRIVNMVLIAAMLILASNMVLAMGIGPSRQYISFVPEQKIQGELIIINDGKEDFKAAIYAQGDLTDYITIMTPLVDVSETEAMKMVQYEINFPLKAPKPGKHKLELVVRQFPPDTQVGEKTVIAANIALISEIIVKVPYPGKYAEGKLFVSGAEDLETPVGFAVMLYNFGTEYIEKARAKVEIFGPTWEKIAEVYTDNRSVKSKEEAKLVAVWEPNVNKGTYNAVVTVYYDNKEFKIEQNFNLGMFAIDVSDISVEKFRLGDVAKFDILLFNSWNRRIEDVYVEMTVEDSNGKEMTQFKTAAIDIDAQKNGLLEAYWYTEGVAPGIYTVKLLVHYAGKVTQKEYEFEVSTNSMTRLGMVGHAITEEEKKEITSKGVIILLIFFVLVILITMNLVWFYMLSRVMKKKGGEK